MRPTRRRIQGYCNSTKGPSQDALDVGLLLVPDAEDECPTVAGLLKFQGCPDTDKDGIEDAKDSCPNVYGSNP